jgi:predicted dehydrogenase
MTRLRALLVGAGGWGRNWGGNLQRSADVEMVGWVDVQPGQAARAAQALGLEGVWTGEDLVTAIAATMPDFVVDAASPDAHYEVTLQALGAGLPVLGEKPMADSMEQARELVTESERAGKLFMVSQNRRYDENLVAMRDLIESEIGGLGALHADFSRGVHFGGFREEMESPLLLDMAIHTFDAARYLSGADPVAVYCDEYNPSWSWYRGNASATAIFEMTGGLRFTYRGTWVGEGFRTAWESEWRAQGPRGTVMWDGQNPPIVEVVIEEGGMEATTERRNVEPRSGVERDIAGSLKDFAHALRTGATPMGECHDNIKSLAMVFAAIESARTGRKIRVDYDQ